MFGFWDWVGGRYSMDSAIGLSTMIAVGPENFRELLAGFHAMDEHFRTTPRSSSNLPVLMGLLAVWYRNFFGAQTVAVLPYDQYLKRFPAYLQQLTMESNGKRHPGRHRGRLRDGRGLLGRARDERPALLLSADPSGNVTDPLRLHRLHAQPEPARRASRHPHREPARAGRGARVRQDAEEVAAEGTPEWLVPHRVFPGNRPTTTILADRLTPRVLGTLVALYEHAVFTQGAIWGVDSFDQWGVELGKVLATRIIPSSWEVGGRPVLEYEFPYGRLWKAYRVGTPLRGRVRTGGQALPHGRTDQATAFRPRILGGEGSSGESPGPKGRAVGV